jgi:hypothetical protein
MSGAPRSSIFGLRDGWIGGLLASGSARVLLPLHPLSRWSILVSCSTR